MAGENKRKIATELSLDGERAFKAAIQGINKDMAVLGSEMSVVTAKFGKNADSMEALTSKQTVYNKQIEEQKRRVDVLKAALEDSAKAYGENSDKTKNWQIALNRAEADLARTENSLRDTTKQIDEFGKESTDSGKEVERAGEKAKKSGDDAQKGEDGWKKFGDRMSKVGEVAGKAIAGLGAAAAGAATAVFGMTAKAAYSADEINTLSKQTGLSTETIQKFQFATEQIDVSMDTLTGSMAKLTRNMSSARDGSKTTKEAFEKLGVQITDNNGELRDNEDVFNDAINALGKMKNETERDALAMKLFGKSAQDLNPLILGGADALKTLGKQAEDAGLILGQDSLDNLNAFSDAMDTFKATLSGSGSLFATAFAGPLAEGVNSVTGYLQQLTTAFTEGGFSAVSDQLGVIATEIITKINDTMPKILEFGLSIVSKIVEGVSANLPVLMEGIMSMMLMLVDTLLGMLPELLKMGLEIIVILAKGIADALPDLIPTIVDTVITIVETLIDNIDMLVDAAIAIIMALADGLIAALPRLIDKAPVIMSKLITAFVNNAPKLIEAGINLIVALAGGLIKAIPQLVSKVPEVVTSMVNGFAGYTFKLVEVGKNLMKGVWEGIQSMATWLRDKVTGFFNGMVTGIKEILGIHSPSRVFGGIGKNMALGLGGGFEDEMRSVKRSINDSIPTSIDIPANMGRRSGSSAWAGGQPIYLDSRLLSTATGRRQSSRNAAFSRAVGVPV